jgi:thioredoxin-like negative regulator of GroEL
MHLGRALMDLGQEREAQQYLAQYEKVRPQKTRGPWRQPGMIESASLPAGERTKREVDRLRREAGAHPDDPELQFRLAGLLLADGQVEEASAEFGVLLGRNAGTRLWQQAGSFLNGFEQYELARQFLERAAAGSAAANLDLAIALSATAGPTKAMEAMEKVPEDDRTGDYFLLKARILDSAGRTAEAELVLEQGLGRTISRTQVCRQAAQMLVRHKRAPAALDLLNRAGGTDPELMLTKAIVLGLLNQDAAAARALQEIEAQWPEWDRPYLAHGLLLERAQPREAAQKFRTAVALGGGGLPARCALARVAGSRPAGPECSCAGGLYELLIPPCQ